MNRLAAVFKLTRIEHSLMSAVAVVAAELVAKGFPGLPLLILSIIPPILSNMAAFAINDYYDVDVDKLNKKNRPLVTGALKRRDALYITVITLVIAIIASAFINPVCLAITIVFGLMNIPYSYKLKELPLIGNAYVALAMAIAFVFGSFVVTPSLGINIILVTVIAFLAGLAREIHGTIRDLRGDMKVRGANTLPKVIGIKGSAALALGLYEIAVLISVYLFIHVAPFQWNALFGIMFGVADIMLLYVGVVFMRTTKRVDYNRTRDISLAAMALATFAILLTPLATFAYI